MIRSIVFGQRSRIPGWGVCACATFFAAAGGATAAVAGFVNGATYKGTTSQHHSITIHVAADGRKATVVAGMRAHCAGRSKYAVRSTYVFDAVFRRNPALISGGRMSVYEVDRNLPPSGFIPRTKVVRQSFAARADAGRKLHGSYSERATLPDGRTCTTGTVTFTAHVS